MWIVVLGSMVEGHRFVGTFESSDEARDWVRNFPSDMEIQDAAIILDLLEPGDLMDKANEFIRKQMQ